MPIFYNKKAIFIRVPKTASRSMFDALADSSEVGRAKTGAIHETASAIRQRIKRDTYDNFFKFAFVRNPWDWVLSWTYYKARIGKLVFGSLDFNQWLINIGEISNDRGGYWSPESEYAHNLLGHKPMPCGLNSCRGKLGFACICLPRDSQHIFITDKNKDSIVDFVGRFEDIENDWAHVCSKINIENKLMHSNKSTHEDYRKEYSDKSAEVIYNIFKTDIEMFGYRF